MNYSNAAILSAVVNRWIQPVLVQLAQGRLDSLPGIQAINNKVRSLGWVSPAWSLTAELSPLMEPITRGMVQPMLEGYLKKVPDAAIPEIAHGIVDKALENGELSIFEGKITFDREDLEELKKLLNYNLPIRKNEEYEVKVSPSENNVDAQAA